MTKCPHHEGVWEGEAPPCPLQKLAEHTITVTEARRAGTGVIVIFCDGDDLDHTASGFNVHPMLALALLEEAMMKIRRAMLASEL